MGKLQGKVRRGYGRVEGYWRGNREESGCGGRAVVVNYASSKEGADRVVSEITSKGGKANCCAGQRRESG